MTTPEEFVAQYMGVEILDALADIDIEPITEAIDAISECREKGHRVYVCGNGGSHATALHFVCDMAKTPQGYMGVSSKAVCLGANPSLLTAGANDGGYESVFGKELSSSGVQSGDVLVAISASGNSPNAIHACDVAKTYGATAISLTGFDGGELRKVADISIHVPCDHYGIVEDVHLVICHAIAYAFAEEAA